MTAFAGATSTAPLSRWQILRRFVLPTLRAHWPAAAALAVLSVVLGFVPALKTELESAVINAINAGLEGTESFEDALHLPVDRLTTDEGGIEGAVLTLASTFFANADLLQAAISYLIITIVAAFLAWVSTVARAQLELDFFTRLRGTAMETLMDPSAAALPLREGDELGVTVQQGAFNIATAYAAWLQAVQYLFALGITTWLVLSKDARLAAAILTVVLLQALVTYVKTWKLRNDRNRLEVERDAVVGASDDIIANRDFIAAHEQRSHFHGVLQELATSYGRIERRLTRRDQTYRALAGVLADGGRLAILFLALAIATGALGARGEISSIGDAYFLLAIYLRMLSPTQGMLSIWDDARRQRDISRRFRTLLAARERLPRHEPGPVDTPSPAAHVACLDDVHYTYATAEGPKPALCGCSLNVPAGKTTLIVGRSGGGKTTIARMVLGFLEPQAGAVAVLGTPVEKWDHDALLERMSYLAQADYVVDDTVRVNLFAPGRSDADLLDALARVSLGDVLEKQASKLSVGEQQRVALARLLLDDADIVLLDEPLSGVDAFTFQELAPELDRYLNRDGRTFVVISHRLAFLSHADHVVLLEDGRVVEEGAPDDLLRQEGRFAALLAAARGELAV